MSKKLHLPIPAKQALNKLGKDIRDARLRRRIGTELMAERAGFSRITLSKVEKGNSGVSIGAYVSALFVLGMLDRLKDIADARHDLTGLMLEEERLPKRIRMPKEKK